MERINLIYNHPTFKRELEALAEDERHREFCKHGLEHLMDVARLCTIYCLEDGMIVSGDVSKTTETSQAVTIELIYAAALLHDIGRHQQNAMGIPHDQGGAQIATQVLRECQFREHEINMVISAIASHRSKDNIIEENRFSENLRRADKKSRLCFACDAIDKCNWSDEKKNLKVGM